MDPRFQGQIRCKSAVVPTIHFKKRMSQSPYSYEMATKIHGATLYYTLPNNFIFDNIVELCYVFKPF